MDCHLITFFQKEAEKMSGKNTFSLLLITQYQLVHNFCLFIYFAWITLLFMLMYIELVNIFDLMLGTFGKGLFEHKSLK